MEFDKAKLMNNINALIKERGLKIGELENELKVSTGYISRMSKPENETMPSVDFVWKIASKLQVSVDFLIDGDYTNATDNLDFMANFIHTLIKETDAMNMDWQRFSNPDTLIETYAMPEFPMIQKGMILDMEAGECRKSFSSLYKPKVKLTMGDENYNAFVPHLGGVLIFKLRDEETGNPVYEMYSADMEEDGIIPLCSSLESGRIVEVLMQDLYTCIDRHEKDLKVSEEARRRIRLYMQHIEETLPFN